MTPEQRRRNRKTALILLAFVAAVFLWSLYRGGMLGGMSGGA